MPKVQRDEHGLTAAEREFVDLYRSGPDEVRNNAARCYKKLHPRCKKSTAETNGPAILRKTHVKAYLALKAQEASEAADLTAERILKEMAKLAFSDIRNLYREDGTLKEPHEWDDATAAAVSSIDVTQEFDGRGEDKKVSGYLKKVKTWDKSKNLEMLAKHFKLLTDKVEHSGMVATTDFDLSNLDKKDRDALRRILTKCPEKPAGDTD